MTASTVEAGTAPTPPGALATIRRGLGLSPELRRGLGGTIAIALVATAGRVIVPIAVQQIIDGFKAGTLDQAEFWIDFAGDKVLIRYYPVRNESGTYLFDLSKDISEQNNLANRMPEKTAEMQKSFEAWLKRMDAAEPRGPFRDF